MYCYPNENWGESTMASSRTLISQSRRWTTAEITTRPSKRGTCTLESITDIVEISTVNLGFATTTRSTKVFPFINHRQPEIADKTGSICR